MGEHAVDRRRKALRATSVALLAACGALVVAIAPVKAAALPSISAKHFASARTCVCHGEQLTNWQRSMHAKALYDPVYVYEKSLANKASGGTLGAFCDTCHTPIGTMAGQTTGKKALSRQSKEGVTCDFCHQVTGTKQPLGNASQTLKANGTKRAQFKDASAPTHANAYSKIHTKAEFCGACHSLTHPTSGAALDSTYADWKAGPYAQLGIVCQDCHMSLSPGGGPATGRAASLGPIRSYIYQMSFVGANVPLGNAAMAEQFLRYAAGVSIESSDVLSEGATGDVRVTVENVGAGHKIPAGVSEIRQMWLDVSLISADGSRKLLGTKRFGTTLRDAEGHTPADLWDAVGVASDTRIAPKGTAEFSYPVRMDNAQSFTVEAVLRYASFPDELAKKSGVSNPVTEMARATKTVYASTREQRAATRSAGSAAYPWLAALVLGGLVALATLFIVRRIGRARRARASM